MHFCVIPVAKPPLENCDRECWGPLPVSVSRVYKASPSHCCLDAERGPPGQAGDGTLALPLSSCVRACVLNHFSRHVQLFCHSGPQPTRLVCPWASPGKNTGVSTPSSRGSSGPRGGTCISYVFCVGRLLLHHWGHLCALQHIPWPLGASGSLAGKVGLAVTPAHLAGRPWAAPEMTQGVQANKGSSLNKSLLLPQRKHTPSSELAPAPWGG